MQQIGHFRNGRMIVGDGATGEVFNPATGELSG